MEKIDEVNIDINSREVKVNIFKLEKEDRSKDISRVYIIANDSNKKVPIIYNSKRDIWGLPGGHVEHGESIKNAALRECIEEIQKTIEDCEERFLLINKIDGNKEQKQVVCFAKLGKNNYSYQDENENVKNIIYTPIDEVISNIGKKNLWDIIIEDFKEWVN